MSDQTYTFFWNGPFSQWEPSEFTLDGIKFTHAEQYMMWRKAMLFNDTETADKVLQAKHPKEQKGLGRTVKGFVREDWEKICKQIVYDGNHAKFTQNPDLLKELMNTGDTLLVEASPYDKIWGIGLNESDARKIPEEKWPGTNYLGEILTQLRERLKQNN